MPVEIGGEQELRSSLGMGGRDKRVDTAVLRSRLEAHYWFLSREALRKYVGSTNVVTLAGGTVLASRKEVRFGDSCRHKHASTNAPWCESALMQMIVKYVGESWREERVR